MFVRPANLPSRFGPVTSRVGGALLAPNRIGGNGMVQNGELPYEFVIEAGLYRSGENLVRFSPEDLWGVLGSWAGRRSDAAPVPVVGPTGKGWSPIGRVTNLRGADKQRTKLVGEIAWDDRMLAAHLFRDAQKLTFEPKFNSKGIGAGILAPLSLESVTAYPGEPKSPEYTPVQNRAVPPIQSGAAAQVASVGRFRSALTGETVTVNRQLLSAMALASNAEPAGVLVDFAHASRETGKSSVAAGWAREFRVEGDRLVARIDWTPLGRPIANRMPLPGIDQEHERVISQFRAGEPAYVEPGFETVALAPGMDRFPVRLTHLALTQTPTLLPA